MKYSTTFYPDDMNRLGQIFVSMLARYANAPSLADELAESRRHRKIWLQLIAVRKMYARRVESLYEDYSRLKSEIEREQRIRHDEKYLSSYHGALTTAVQVAWRWRLDNGQWLLTIAALLERWNVVLSGAELRTAFSISDEDWTAYSNLFDELNIPQIMIGALIGDDALSDQVVDCMIATLMSVDENTRDRVCLKFPTLVRALDRSPMKYS